VCVSVAERLVARISQKRGQKLQRRGQHFKNTILDERSNRRAKHKMGATDFKWGQGTPVPARTVARKFLIRGLCVSVGGLEVCAGGLDALNIDEISTDL